MKKVSFYLVSALTGLLMLSCSNGDQNLAISPENGAEKESVRIYVTLPYGNQVQSRADDDDDDYDPMDEENGNYGGGGAAGYTTLHGTGKLINRLVIASYVYDSAEKKYVPYAEGSLSQPLEWEPYIPAEGADQTNENKLDCGTMTFIRGSRYKIFFFAYAEGAPYEFDVESHMLTIKYGDDPLTYTTQKNPVTKEVYKNPSSDEWRDIFMTVKEFNLTSNDKSITAVLKRPFAQLNFYYYDPVDWKMDALYTSVSMELPTKYDVLTGKVSEKKEVEFEPTITTTLGGERPIGKVGLFTETMFSVKEHEDSYSLASMTYLAVDSEETKDITLHVYTIDDARPLPDPLDEDALTITKINDVTVTNVPFKPNYKTNIFGDITKFPVACDFFVSLVPSFDGTSNGEYPQDNGGDFTEFTPGS